MLILKELRTIGFGQLPRALGRLINFQDEKGLDAELGGHRRKWGN